MNIGGHARQVPQQAFELPIRSKGQTNFRLGGGRYGFELIWANDLAGEASVFQLSHGAFDNAHNTIYLGVPGVRNDDDARLRVRHGNAEGCWMVLGRCYQGRAL